MSLFPSHDHFWKAALNYVRASISTNDTISGPAEFRKIVCNWSPLTASFEELGQWIIIHKGQLEWMDYQTAQKVRFLVPVFANEVFVIMAQDEGVAPTTDRKHVDPLYDKLKDLARGPLSFGTRNILEATARKRRLAVGIGDGRVLCKVLGRHTMIVDMEALEVAPHLIADGFWESWITAAISRYMVRGGYYVDIGANIGYYATMFAAAAGNEGQVLAIEPRPSFCEVTKQNMVLNGKYGHWEVVQAAAGNANRSKQTTLWEPGGYASSSYTGSAPMDAEHKRIAKVPVVSVDRLVEDWPRVDIVKIDAEGANRTIWEGLRETRKRPGVMFFVEYAPSLPRDVKWLLGARREGFRVCHVGNQGELIEGLPENLNDWIMLCLTKPGGRNATS